jgi:hypothetical protein
MHKPTEHKTQLDALATLTQACAWGMRVCGCTILHAADLHLGSTFSQKLAQAKWSLRLAWPARKKDATKPLHC